MQKPSNTGETPDGVARLNHTKVAELSDYDSLPKCVREYLADAPFNFSASFIADLWSKEKARHVSEGSFLEMVKRGCAATVSAIRRASVE